MSLTIEHIAAYLPYKLKVLDDTLSAAVVTGVMHLPSKGWMIEHDGMFLGIDGVKPVLRPMSSAVEYFMSIDNISLAIWSHNLIIGIGDPSTMKHCVKLKFYKHKIDIDSLILQGLAVSCADAGVDYDV